MAGLGSGGFSAPLILPEDLFYKQAFGSDGENQGLGRGGWPSAVIPGKAWDPALAVGASGDPRGRQKLFHQKVLLRRMETQAQPLVPARKDPAASSVPWVLAVVSGESPPRGRILGGLGGAACRGGGPGCCQLSPRQGKPFPGDPRSGKAWEQPGPGGTRVV